MTRVHLFANNHRGSPRAVHQCSFTFVSGHQCNSEVSENRPSEHRVSFLVQHDSEICNLPLYSKNLVKLQHLDLDIDLDLLLFLLKMFSEILA